jgi:acetyl-CoA/propionyl-CoA carboxylase biotin carboxyl carrier protein
MTVPQAFDSLIAKLIVTGADRAGALERSRRALAEFEIGGMPTVLPFHRLVVDDPAFTSEPFTVHTGWIETEFAGDLPPYAGDTAAPGGDGPARERITVEVGGKRLEVVIPAGLAGAGPGGAPSRSHGAVPAGRPAGSRRRGAGRGSGQAGAAAGGDALVSPMQGTIVKIVAAEGQHVSAGDTVVVLEAMKMEQPLTAHKDGTVTGLAVQVGQTVPAGEIICQLRD